MGLYFCKPDDGGGFDTNLPPLPPEREVWNQLEGVARAYRSPTWNRSDEDLAREALECAVILHKYYDQSLSYICSICQENLLMHGTMHFYPKETPLGLVSHTKESPYQHHYVLEVYFGDPEEWRVFQKERLGIYTPMDLQAKLFKTGFYSTLMCETRYRVP